tara:strand:- start:1091 stop:1273 length:183 start_codon:yes stop_codon:yes gene_type:complete
MWRRWVIAGLNDRIQTRSLLIKLLTQTVDLLLQFENVLLLSCESIVQRPHRLFYERQLRL